MTKKETIIIIGLASAVLCTICVLGGVILTLLTDNSVETTSVSAVTPQATSAPICTEPRFGSYLSPDDVDVLLEEGEVLGEYNPVRQISVRFDCPKISPERISFKWYFNGQSHCTRTYLSGDCDRSDLTHWDRRPGLFLVSLYSKDPLSDLPSGEYRLVILVDGKKESSGTVRVNP